jgi:hypothetical protein
LRAAKALSLSEDEIQEIETAIAYSPEDGDLIEGAGGIRKRRFAIPGRNKGKSGGVRIFTAFFHAGAPVIFSRCSTSRWRLICRQTKGTSLLA